MLYNELYEENVFNFSDGVCMACAQSMYGLFFVILRHVQA